MTALVLVRESGVTARSLYQELGCPKDLTGSSGSMSTARGDVRFH